MFKNAILAMLLLLPVTLFAEISQGEVLETKFWQDIKDQKWSEVESRIAPYFQSVQPDGVHNKDQELAAIKNLNVTNFILSDVKTTGDKDILVVTYVITLAETLKEQRLVANAYRLSVWQNNNGNWQEIAHANLNPVPPEGTKVVNELR
jgi:hypothetical protein